MDRSDMKKAFVYGMCLRFIMSLIVMGGGSAYGSEKLQKFTQGEMGREIAISNDTKIVLFGGGSGMYVRYACVFVHNGKEWEPRLWRHLYSHSRAEDEPKFFSYSDGVLLIGNRNREEVCRKELPLGDFSPQEQAEAKACLGDHLIEYSSCYPLLKSTMIEKGLRLLRESAEEGCPLGMKLWGTKLIRRGKETHNKQMEEEGQAWINKANKAMRESAEEGCPLGMQLWGVELIRRGKETHNKQMEEEGQAWINKANKAK